MLNYIPKYVRQDSNLAYGEKVTHENYNEKLNLNTTLVLFINMATMLIMRLIMI